ncbi:hypothetical protein [Clostridium thermosuccinogenes]|nr:hypothetical protein [Pseudoclostridium thermosuccinogenes]
MKDYTVKKQILFRLACSSDCLAMMQGDSPAWKEKIALAVSLLCASMPVGIDRPLYICIDVYTTYIIFYAKSILKSTNINNY